MESIREKLIVGLGITASVAAMMFLTIYVFTLLYTGLPLLVAVIAASSIGIVSASIAYTILL